MAETRYAGFWIRLLAAILDAVVFAPVFAIAFFAMWLTGYETISNIIMGLLVFLTIYLEGMVGGTPGKLICGIRIVNKDKQYIGIPHAMLRTVCRLFCLLTLGVGYFMVAFDEKKQGLHDKIADTYVIYKK